MRVPLVGCGHPSRVMKVHFVMTLALALFGGTAGDWTQVGQDIDGDEMHDYFGKSVCISEDGSIMAAGSHGSDGNAGVKSGHVGVFQKVGASWVKIGGLNGEAASDQSGVSLSLSSTGTIVAVGAQNNDGANGANSGHVRVYQWNQLGGGWNQLGGDIDGEASHDYSGVDVSLSSDGHSIAIGAHLNDGNGDNSGHTRIFDYVNDDWHQRGGDIEGEAGDWSGVSVSLCEHGTTVAIGAMSHNDNRGTTRIFEYDNSANSWVQIGLKIDGEAATDSSGYSVSLANDGTTVAIGATKNAGNGYDSGHTRMFKWSGTAWEQLGYDIDGEFSLDQSGCTVSLSSDGTAVAIGAKLNDGNGFASGHTRVFKYDGADWIQIGSDIDGEASNDYSGTSVALSGDGTTVAIGAPGNDADWVTPDGYDSENVPGDFGHVRVYENADMANDDVETVVDETASLLTDDTDSDSSGVPCWKSHSCTHGTCFHASGTVLLEEIESGGTKALTKKTMTDLQVGDLVQTANFDGELSFSPVVFLPHHNNDEVARFLTFKTTGGKSVLLTPDHLVPTCSKGGRTVVARDLRVGHCLLTVDGEETVASVQSSIKHGIYTAITENKFIVVDGVILSPFAQDRKIERQHQTRERQRLLQRERMLLRKGDSNTSARGDMN